MPSYLINAGDAGRAGAAPGAHAVPAAASSPTRPSRARSWTSIVKPWQITRLGAACKPVGCVDCRMTGYMGRMGLYELLSISEAFKAQVTKEPEPRAGCAGRP